MKTEDKIIEAFLSLLNTHQVDQITIQNLCKQANISRVTFYAYFSNLNSIFSYLVFDRYLKNKMNPYRDIKEGLTAATDFILKHRIFFKKLLRSSKRKEFIEFVRFQGNKHHLRWIDKFDAKGMMSEIDRQLMATFYASGFTQLFIRWIDQDFSPKKQVFVERTYLILKGYIQLALYNFEFFQKYHRLPTQDDIESPLRNALDTKTQSL